MEYNNGITIEGNNSIMSGTWWNPKTKHKFTVADVLMQDSQMYVKTTKGEMLDYNIIKGYVQITDKEGKEIDETLDSTEEIIPPEIQDLISGDGDINNWMDKDDIDFMNNPKRPSKKEEKVESPNLLMIKKVLDNEPLPFINIEMNWEDIPTKKIETLIDVLGVEPSEIVDYYINKCTKEIDLHEEFSTKLGIVVKDTISSIVEDGAPEFMISCEDRKMEEIKKEEKKRPAKKNAKQLSK